MRLLVIDWCRHWQGAQRQRPQAHRFALDHPKLAFALIVGLGNGNYEEACVEADSPQALEGWRAMLIQVGSAVPVEPDAAMRASRMYRPGYDAYDQAGNWFFVNPRPRPELFQDGPEYERYLAEFARPEDEARYSPPQTPSRLRPGIVAAAPTPAAPRSGSRRALGIAVLMVAAVVAAMVVLRGFAASA